MGRFMANAEEKNFLSRILMTRFNWQLASSKRWKNKSLTAQNFRVWIQILLKMNFYEEISNMKFKFYSSMFTENALKNLIRCSNEIRCLFRNSTVCCIVKTRVWLRNTRFRTEFNLILIFTVSLNTFFILFSW